MEPLQPVTFKNFWMSEALNAKPTLRQVFIQKISSFILYVLVRLDSLLVFVLVFTTLSWVRLVIDQETLVVYDTYKLKYLLR